jgi:hypothetical protein
MKPIVQPLSYWRRTVIFVVLLTTFLLCLPAFMFYATGYRYDIFSVTPSITVTGGLYISAEAFDNKIFLNDEEVTNARVFRNASYIQGLEPGLQKVHIQAPGLHTWVKDLSVYPHIVTEAESFNVPVVPHVRPVTEYQTVNDEAVFFVASSTDHQLFTLATTSIPFVATTSRATSTYSINPEYISLMDFFIEKASTTKSRIEANEEKAAFGFSTTSTSTTDKSTATTTVVRNNLVLYQSGDDVYVEARGTGRQIPHYFCTSQVEMPKVPDTQENLVGHEEGALFFEGTIDELSNNTRECRSTIKIDRKWQTVHDFTFFPNNEDLLLMHLDDGIYVVEVDDRGWQNSQLLYGGKDLMFIVYSDGIFVKDGDALMEVYTELTTEE